VPEPAYDALIPYGWDERVAALVGSAARDDTVAGRVVRVERAPKEQGFIASAIVRLPDGDVLATSADDFPAVGDWVLVRVVDDDTKLLEVVLDRWSALTRQDPGDEHSLQVLAANIDVVLIVAPLDRLRIARVERELLVAWESGARPVVVLSKADVADDLDRTLDEVQSRLAGADVVVTSARSGAGLDEIAAVLHPNRTAVLFGPSGAGKSSLANALLGDDVLATGDVREGDHRGRHTTTSRQLVPLPRGGVLIDTPGIRSISVWRGEEGLSAAFADVEEVATACRFRDCRHQSEPGCAVHAAVADGSLDAQRVASYLKLLREVEYAEHAHELQYQQERKRKWKAIHKASRDHPKKR